MHLHYIGVMVKTTEPVHMHACVVYVSCCFSPSILVLVMSVVGWLTISCFLFLDCLVTLLFYNLFS